jgi:hypothetical protein
MRMYSALACRSSGVAMTVNWIARSSPKVSYAHFRTERISLTAAIPLFAMSTCRKAQCQHTPNYRIYGLPHICNDRVSIVRGHKVLDLARRRMAEFVASDEVRRKVELGCVGARGAISIPIDSVLCSSGHVVCWYSHALWEVSVWEEEVGRGRGSGYGSVRDRSIFHWIRASWSSASSVDCRSKCPEYGDAANV